MDNMAFLLQFEDAMKSGPPTMMKNATHKTSGLCFGGNQPGSSNRPTHIELGHIKPRCNYKKDFLKVHYYCCNQFGHYDKDCPQVKRGNLSNLDATKGTLLSTDVTQ